MMKTFDHDTLNANWAAWLAGAGKGWTNRAANGAAPGSTATRQRQEPLTIDGVTGEIDEVTGPTVGTGPASQSVPGPDWLQYVPVGVRDLVASHLPPGLPDTLGPVGHGFTLPGSQSRLFGAAPAAPNMPEGAQFLSSNFTNPAGSRPYKLYVPSGYIGQPVALVVMLHGCTQSPDDFAAGTGMNDAAEQQTFLVVYPGQTTSAHAQKCWKWFNPDDQRRGTGEPSLIAGITRQVMQDYAVDPRRVYVAGLSAGGAAAAVMGETYPDLYAAIGVHSGLACGVASDLPSALAAMRGGAQSGRRTSGSDAHHRVPTIVFHGDRDTTVSPRNADAVAEQSVGDASARTQIYTGQTPGGHGYSLTVHRGGTGKVSTEQWLIHGAGHAWSGGSVAGSYTDPRGPDATQEMLRFFWEHPHSSLTSGE